MKVLNLACPLGHSFEGWFGSEDDFQLQRQNGLLTCPVCGDGHVTKLPSAPRLNLRGGTAVATGDADSMPSGSHPGGQQHALQHMPPATDRSGAAQGAKQGVQPPESQAFSNDMRTVFLTALRAVMANTEDVGDQFPEHVRRMHHGEVAPKAIRGEATHAQARELLDEGIDVVPMPFLSQFKKNTLQ